MTDALALEYQPRRTSGTFYYGWVNLAVAALAMVATLPGRTQGLGLITEPLLRDLHVNKVDYGLQNLWATIIGSVFSLACGPLIDRIGARAVLFGVLAALGGTVLAMSRVSSAAGLFITLTLTRGFGQSALSVVSLALVGKWFSRKLPIAMGIYSLGVGIGFFIAFPGIYQLVNWSDWRHVWNAMGWVLLAGLAPLALLLTRRSPESVGLIVDGAAGEKNPVAADEDSQTGLTLADALCSPAFWVFALSASAFGLMSSGLMLYNESVLVERGLDKRTVTIVLAIIAFTGLVANFLGGWLAGKWRVGKLMSGAMFMLAAGLFCLPFGHGRLVAYLYAVMMGMAAGTVTVAFFICWGKVFGRRHLGAIQGAAQGLTVLASAIGPWLLALCMHRYGSTTPLFYSAAPVVAGLGLLCALVPIPKIRNIPDGLALPATS